MPKVSVIIPNYNHARFLKKRVKSIVDQTFKNIEIILINDGSTDNSLEVINEILNENPNINFINNIINGGKAYYIWNQGVELSKGEYIWIAEADDLAEEHFLEVLVKKLDEYSNVRLAYCQNCGIDEDNIIWGTSHNWTEDLDPNRWNDDFMNNGIDEICNYLIFKNTIPNVSAVVFRKSVFEAVGYADTQFKLCSDWITYIKMLSISDIYYCSYALARFRTIISQSARAEFDNKYNLIYEYYSVANFILKSFKIEDYILENVKDKLKNFWIEKGTNLDFPFSGEDNSKILEIANLVDSEIFDKVGKILNFEISESNNLLDSNIKIESNNFIDNFEENSFVNSYEENSKMEVVFNKPVFKRPDKKSKILFVSHDAFRAGAEILILNLIKWVSENTDYDFDILLGKGGELVPEFEAIKPVIIFNQLTEDERWELIAYYKKENIGIAYINTLACPELYDYLKHVNLKFITHVHELENSTRLADMDKISTYTHTFIVCSNAAKINLNKNHGLYNIKLVYEYIYAYETEKKIVHNNRQDILRELNLPEDAFVVGASGTTDWRKSPELFIHLTNILIKRNIRKPIYFVWIGGLFTYEMLYDLQKANIYYYFRHIPGTDRPFDYYNAFDVFVLTSRVDPYPIVCLESASLGKPVICFENAGGMPEFVEDDAGFVVPYLDLEAIADRIEFLINNPDLKLQLGNRAKEKVRERHDINIAAQQIVDIIENIF